MNFGFLIQQDVERNATDVGHFPTQPKVKLERILHAKSHTDMSEDIEIDSIYDKRSQQRTEHLNDGLSLRGTWEQ